MTADAARDIRTRLEPRVDEMAALLIELVGIESASDDPAGLETMADRLELLFGDFGQLDRHRTGPGGASHLVLEVPGDRADLPPLAVLTHFDTVWPAGTLADMPAVVDGNGRLTGPGCFDMKGGLVLLWYALGELRATGRAPRRDVRILFSCDEEVRSRTARPLIGKLADGVTAALVLEAPLPGGVLKTARKGAAIYRVDIAGRAAHAGIEPGKGASAIIELAHQIHALHALTDESRGTTVNVGVVSGGTRPNVVPDRATAQIDVRTSTLAEAERVDNAIKALRPQVPGTRVTAVPDLSRPPMEPTAASRRLFDLAREVAAGMGISDLACGATGGASDANLVAAMGIPTLDGLGPEGGGAHAPDEHVLIESMPRRAALIAGLLTTI